MATTDTRISVGDNPRAGLVYDGFLSYSHAADDLLAPRLQAGLQRFAKPWWRRRAVRIFRDEASLAANPHLWGSITEALDDSAWFILLLSSEAASSEWVDREVEYWLANNEPDRIIPVLTDGDFTWTDGDFVSDAAPPALSGVFADEPRWVDLRFARTEEQLDLNNAAFRAAVADIASAVRGIPKDELESEEVRQHRRTIRTAWAGGIALLLLTVLAGATATYAIGQTNEVAVQRDIAEQGEAEATEFAQQVLGFSGQRQSSAAPAGSDFVRADQRNIPLRVVASPPSTTRMAFLETFCNFPGAEEQRCFAATYMLHPTEPLGVQAWLAYEPFHIRHGFVNPNDEPLGSAFPPDFELQVFVTRREGPPLPDDLFAIDQTYRFTPDYLVRVSSERCGSDFLDQTVPRPCDEFVHEFPDGLPPGKYDFWVEWWAQCSAWTTADVCVSDATPFPLFAAAAPDYPMYHDDYTPFDNSGVHESFFEENAWPYDPWQSAEKLAEP